MTRVRAALLLLLVQLLLVSSIAAKYLYERKTCPRVWSRATQYDPNLPLRGRYLALQLRVDACHLPRDPAHLEPSFAYGIRPGKKIPRYWSWNVSLSVANGHLVPVLEDHPKSPTDTLRLMLEEDRQCDRTPVLTTSEFFIPDRAQSPFPLKQGQELWVEVTLPPAGPPRPVQLAISTKSSFQILKF